MSEELNIGAIKARLAERRKPHIGTCATCGNKQALASTWLPMASGMASEMWRCQQCGGQITITVMTSTTGPSVDDDLHDLLTEIERLRAALGSRGVHEEQIRQLPTYAMNLYGTEFGGLIERDKVLAALRGVGTPQEKAQRQELINDLYRLFTMTTQEIAAEFGEARCKDDSARINYALELLADHVTDCATATDEPFFKPNADFKQVKDWVKAVPLSTPHQEEKAP